MFQIDDTVMPEPVFFPYQNAPDNLHRDCKGRVVRVNGNKITVDWNPKGKNPQKYTYDISELMKA